MLCILRSNTFKQCCELQSCHCAALPCLTRHVRMQFDIKTEHACSIYCADVSQSRHIRNRVGYHGQMRSCWVPSVPDDCDRDHAHHGLGCNDCHELCGHSVPHCLCCHWTAALHLQHISTVNTCAAIDFSVRIHIAWSMCTSVSPMRFEDVHFSSCLRLCSTPHGLLEHLRCHAKVASF